MLWLCFLHITIKSYFLKILAPLFDDFDVIKYPAGLFTLECYCGEGNRGKHGEVFEKWRYWDQLLCELGVHEQQSVCGGGGDHKEQSKLGGHK